MLTNTAIFQISASHKSKYIFNDSLKSDIKKKNMIQDPIHSFKIKIFLNERVVQCTICKYLSHLITMITIKMPLNQRKEIITPHISTQLFIPLQEIQCVFEILENYHILHNSHNVFEDCKPNFTVFTKYKKLLQFYSPDMITPIGLSSDYPLGSHASE